MPNRDVHGHTTGLAVTNLGAASFWDGHDRAALRIGLALIVGIELAAECSQIAWQSGDPHFGATGTIAVRLAEIPGAAWILLALALGGLVALGLDRAAILGGALTLAVGAMISAWQTALVGSPSRNAFFPGAALLGWILGQAWAWWLLPGQRALASRPLRERLGEAGALGCIAAAYVGSCASKLIVSGSEWAEGMQLRALILRQLPPVEWGWVAAWRASIVDHDVAAAAAAVATLAIEGGAWLLLVGPRLRLAWAGALISLHIAILLLCTMPYLEPVALLVLFAVPWPRIAGHPARATPDDSALPRAPAMVAVVLVALVLIAGLLAPLGWTDTP